MASSADDLTVTVQGDNFSEVKGKWNAILERLHKHYDQNNLSYEIQIKRK